MDFWHDRELYEWGDMSEKIYARSNWYQEYKRNGKKSTASLDMWYKNHVERVKKLTPVAREWLTKMHAHFELINYEYITRSHLCTLMRKPTGLGAWDRKVLQKLIAARFITCERAKCKGSNAFEYRYKMSLDTGWMLYMMKKAAKRSKRKKSA